MLYYDVNQYAAVPWLKCGCRENEFLTPVTAEYFFKLQQLTFDGSTLQIL